MKILVTLVLALSAAGAGAQAPDCNNAITQFDMNACAAQEAQKADAALNATYQKFMGRLSVPSKSALRDAQRAWITFRDKECFFESNGTSGGTVSPMVRSGCIADLTKERTKALAAKMTCPEGDVSCVG